MDLRSGVAAGLNTYVVRVHTSDVRGAGTDANVRLTLFGRSDASLETQYPPTGEKGAVTLPVQFGLIRSKPSGFVVWLLDSRLVRILNSLMI